MFVEFRRILSLFKSSACCELDKYSLSYFFFSFFLGRCQFYNSELVFLKPTATVNLFYTVFSI